MDRVWNLLTELNGNNMRWLHSGKQAAFSNRRHPSLLFGFPIKCHADVGNWHCSEISLIGGRPLVQSSTEARRAGLGAVSSSGFLGSSHLIGEEGGELLHEGELKDPGFDLASPRRRKPHPRLLGACRERLLILYFTSYITVSSGNYH